MTVNHKSTLHWFLLAVILVILYAYPCEAQLSLVSTPTDGSARMIGMGSAVSALADDAGAFASNPAGLCFERSYVLSGMYSSLHGSLGTPLANRTWTGICVPISDFSVAANWVRFQSNDIRSHTSLLSSDIDQDEISVKNDLTRNFLTHYEDAMSLSVARNNILRIDWGWNQYILPVEFPIGATLRYTHASLNGSSATAWSADLATMMRINLRDMFFDDNYPYISASLSWKNVGAVALNWKSGRSDLYPSCSVLGIAVVQPLHGIESEVRVDYEHWTTITAGTRFGVEWKYRKFYFLRAGWCGPAFACGIGADLRFFTVDYAYQSSSENLLGDNHHFTIAFRLERLFL